MADPVGEEFLVSTRIAFERLRDRAEKALAQVDDEAFMAGWGPEDNSIAILVQHLAGNLRSRWTQFLTTDGEKPDRDRDSEFEFAPGTTRRAIMERWET